MASNPSVALESVREAMSRFLEAYRLIDFIADRARELAPTAKIKDAIDVSYVNSGGGEGISTAKITVDLSIAPEGRAYEYGSGEHARRGSAVKYPINGNPVLVFYWQARSRWVSTPQVMHPGVEARPTADRGYMATAIQESKTELAGRIQKEFGTLVSKAIRVSFSGGE